MSVAERTYATKDCPDCHGTGQLRGHAGYPGTGAYRPPVNCAKCTGTGKVRKHPPRRPPKPKFVPPPEPKRTGREVRFIYPDGRKWDSVALVVLEDGTLDYCQGYDFGYGWLVWGYAGYDTIDGKPIYKVHGRGTRSQLGV